MFQRGLTISRHTISLLVRPCSSTNNKARAFTTIINNNNTNTNNNTNNNKHKINNMAAALLPSQNSPVEKLASLSNHLSSANMSTTTTTNISRTKSHENIFVHGTHPVNLGDAQQQIKRALLRVQSKKDELSKYEYLDRLRSDNVHLFYALLLENLHELTPLVYTPTIGLACQHLSELHVPRGTPYTGQPLHISLKDKGRLLDVMQAWKNQKGANHSTKRIACVTDGSRILGLGDLGADGMGIPIGKLSLYIACAGIRPEMTLPVLIDMGTDNPQKLEDPLYAGLRQRRPEPDQVKEFVKEFVEASQTVWPGMLTQWEDWSTTMAFDLLDEYKDKIPSFNDDIQGTAATCLAGLICAFDQNNVALQDNRFVLFGAGSAAVGIAKLVYEYFVNMGIAPESAKNMFWLVDSKGLVTDDRGDILPEHKKFFSRKAGTSPQLRSLYEVVENVKPTALVGLSTVGGSFDEKIVRKMAELNQYPIIMPLSNPVSKSECTFKEAVNWTDGRVLFASGSPFEPIEYNGRRLVPGQGNNVYVFPGVGLGASESGASRVTPGMMHAAAKTLASCVTKEEIAEGRTYPALERIREVTAKIAWAVIQEADKENVGGQTQGGNKDESVRDVPKSLEDVTQRMYNPLEEVRHF